jgi:hypothetical protein
MSKYGVNPKKVKGDYKIRVKLIRIPSKNRICPRPHQHVYPNASLQYIIFEIERWLSGNYKPRNKYSQLTAGETGVAQQIFKIYQ